MKSQTSFYHKGLVREDLRHYSLAGIFFFLFMFLMSVLVLYIGVEYYAEGADLRMVIDQFYLNPVYLIGVGLMPFYFGIALFRDMHHDNSMTATHSMPVSRRQLFVGRYWVFTLYYIGSILINGLFVLLILVSKGFVFTQVLIAVFSAIIALLLAGYTLFSLTVMLGMITGSDIFQGVTTIVVLILPIFIGELVNVFSKLLIQGLPMDFYNERWYYASSVGVSILVIIWERFDGFEYNYFAWLIVGGYGILTTVTAYILYQKRALERYHRVLVFDWLKRVFICFMTAMIVMVICTIFGRIVTNHRIGVYIAVVPSALIGYYISKMIAEKTTAVGKYYKGSGLAVVIALLVVLGIGFDITGNQRYIPETEEIEWAYYSRDPYMSLRVFKDDYHDPLHNFGRNDVFVREPVSIDIMRNIHQKAIDEVDIDEGSYSSINIIYQLKNGQLVQRIYENYDVASYEAALYENQESKEYYLSNMRSLAKETEQVMITMFDGTEIVVEVGQIDGLMDAFEMDYLELDYYELHHSNRYANIEFVIDEAKNNSEYFSFNGDYIHTSAWLEAHGIEIIAPTTDGLKEAFIVKTIEGDKTFFTPKMHHMIAQLKNATEVEATTMIIDQEVLEGLFALGNHPEVPKSDSYQIHFKYESGQRYSTSLVEIPEAFEPYVSYYKKN